jgi:hypothetical protein
MFLNHKYSRRYSGGGGNPPSTEPKPAAPAAPPAPKADEKPAEKTFTQAELTAVAAKEAGKAQKALMARLGIENEDGITAFLEQQKAIKEAQEKAEADKPELDRLKGESAKSAEKMKASELKIAELEAKVVASALENAVYKIKGYTDEQHELAFLKLEKTVKSVDDIAGAIEDYVKAKPPAESKYALLFCSRISNRHCRDTPTSGANFSTLPFPLILSISAGRAVYPVFVPPFSSKSEKKSVIIAEVTIFNGRCPKRGKIYVLKNLSLVIMVDSLNVPRLLFCLIYHS